MKIYYLLHFFWSLGAIACGTFAFASHDYNFLLFCAILLWVNNIQYALRHFKERSYFFFFNLTFFIFLLGRPIFLYYKDGIGLNMFILIPAKQMSGSGLS